MLQVTSGGALRYLFNSLTAPPVEVIKHCWCLLYLLWTEVGVGLSHFARPPLYDCIAEHSNDHDKQEVASVHQVKVDEGAIIIWNNDGEFGVECMIHFADRSFVTPEGVVLLTVLCVRVADGGEHLVPRRRVGVRLRHAVRRLHCDREDVEIGRAHV